MLCDFRKIELGEVVFVKWQRGCGFKFGERLYFGGGESFRWRV